jgi:hypothetical protein
MLEDAKAEEAKGDYGIPRTTPDHLDSVTIFTRRLRELVESTQALLASGSSIPQTARTRCELQLKNAELVLEARAPNAHQPSSTSSRRTSSRPHCTPWARRSSAARRAKSRERRVFRMRHLRRRPAVHWNF